MLHIGIHKERVIELWGKSEDINKTVSSVSTREQWGYTNWQEYKGNGDFGKYYLFFDNGKLS